MPLRRIKTRRSAKAQKVARRPDSASSTSSISDDGVDISLLIASEQAGLAARQLRSLYNQGQLSKADYLQQIIQLTMRLTDEKPVATLPPCPSIQHEMMEAQLSFTDPDVRRFNAFRAKEAAFQKQLSRAEGPLEGLRSVYETAVEAHDVSPLVGASAAILLGLARPEGVEESAETRIARWFEFFVNEPAATRLYRYNAFLVDGLGAAEVAQWREVLSEVEVPLVPPTERLARYNRQLYQEALSTKTLSGGAHAGRSTCDKPVHRTLYRHPDQDEIGDKLEGGGYQAPVYGPDGSQVAALDLSALEAALADLSAKVERLRNRDLEVGTALVRRVRDAPTHARMGDQEDHRAINVRDLKAIIEALQRTGTTTRARIRDRSRERGTRYGTQGHHGGGTDDEESDSLVVRGTSDPKSLRKGPPAGPLQGSGTALKASAKRTTPREHFSRKLWGGDLLAGKTSNVELDAIYNRYLSTPRIVPCDTMVRLTPQRAKTLAAKVHQCGVVYLPIFIMKHWIAGVLSMQPGSEETLLTVHDSAPSLVVQQRLQAILRRVWPSLKLAQGYCPRQQRNSDDCGLYMTATFFCHMLGLRVANRRDLPACLRKLLHAAKQYRPPVEYFLEKIRKVLTNHPVSRKAFFYEEMARAPWRQVGKKERPTVAFRAGGRPTRSKPHTKTSAAGQGSNASKQRSTRSHAMDASVPTRFGVVAASSNRAAHRPDLTNPPLPPRRQSAKRPSRAARAAEEAMVLGRIEAPRTTPQGISTTGITVANAPHTTGAPVGRPVAGWIESTLEEANKHARKAYEGVLDHLWAATALAMCGDGVSRGLSPTAIGMQRVRFGLADLQPYSIQDMLRLLHKTVHVVDAREGGSPNALFFQLVEGGPQSSSLDPLRDEYYLIRGPNLTTLPSTIQEFGFVLGARLVQAPTDMDGVRYPSYYALTRNAADATVGVYLPQSMTHYSAAKPKRAHRNATRQVPPVRSDRLHNATAEVADNGEVSTRPMVPRRRVHWADEIGASLTNSDDNVAERNRSPGRRQPNEDADVDGHISEEATRALEEIRAHPLNLQGRSLTRSEEAETCPRNWFLFDRKPPHVSQLAWNAVRPDTRAHHIRWLARIKAMPHQSLLMGLPAACIDLILSSARARRWKWATTAKAFAGVAGALRDLPMYSTQSRGIRLQDDPEWRSAFSAVQRYMKESVPDAPPFVTLRHVQAVLNRLRKPHPRAALFLAMMWGFAARACDIATLRAKDVTVFAAPDGTSGALPSRPQKGQGDDPGVRVTITIRRGKGAKKRGPYPVPSVLTRELAATLQELLIQRRPAEELFAPHTEQLRTIVAHELGRELKGAQLPSVRKGALRCMAEAGVPTRDLMTISGHAKQATLLRYLGYGQQPTAEAEAARAGAHRALFPTQ